MLGIRRNSLSYKTTLIYVVLAVIIISVFNFIIWENQSDLIIENQKLTIEATSLKLKRIVQGSIQNRKNANLKRTFESIADRALKQGIIQTVVYSESGNILYSWEPMRTYMAADTRELVLINRSIARYELEKKQFLHRTDVSRGTISLYLPAPVSRGTELAVVKFVLPLLELTEKKNEVLRICLLVALFVCALQIVMALFLRRMIINPISKLVEMTIKVSQGDLNQQMSVTQNDELGILTKAYNEMVVNLRKMQEEAKGANPLTGLPGNLAIMNTIDRRLNNKEEIAVIYGDLDNFKAYNDNYGLNKGDQAILHCRDSLLTAARECGRKKVFIGHEGGDDFVVVAPFDMWETLCKNIVSAFDKGVAGFYNEQHNEQGYMDARDRQGNEVKYPLMSLSLAVVSNHFRPVRDHRTLIAWASEMKRMVKKMEGSSFAIDKRRY
ncbi:GGDEF domain-containing protein [Fibrobacterota bacterium]